MVTLLVCCVFLGGCWFLLRVVTWFLGGFVGGGCISLCFWVSRGILGAVEGACGDATFALAYVVTVWYGVGHDE